MEAVQGNSDNESSTDSNFEDEVKDSLNDSDNLEKENRCPGDYISFLFFTLHALFVYATYV